ncbi:MAG: thioredoxin domain-containing protein [Phycisphaerae bacterium]|nr:thioredoxin domain-containing protein [Phycisphaerae bacterium]MCZ2398903.1 thioredoxin domain-containing protein [Phycisphaerae bacterium]
MPPPQAPSAPLEARRPTDRPSGRLLLRLVTVALAALGWWLSIDLLSLTGGGAATNPILHSFCSDAADGPHGDCLSILRSPRAYLGRGESGGGLPWATLGAAYFAAVGMWFTFVGPTTRSRFGWHLLVLVVLGAGLLVSVTLTNAMASELRRWCAGCLFVHAVNAALFLTALLAFPWRQERSPAAAHPSTPLALATLCAAFFVMQTHVLATSTAMLSTRARSVEKSYLEIIQDPNFALWAMQRRPAVALPPAVRPEWVGDEHAPHTLLLFSDFECPHCKTLYETLAGLLERHPTRLRVAHFHYPIDAECNPHVKRTIHPNACAAARALEAARIVGGAEAARRMSRLLYQRQAQLQMRRFADWAVEIGLDRAAFEAALADERVAQRIRADVDLAESLGVDRSPALYVDGRLMEYWMSPQTLEGLILAEPAAERAAASAPATP